MSDARKARNLQIPVRGFTVLTEIFCFISVIFIYCGAFAATSPTDQVDVFTRGATPGWMAGYTDSIDITTNGAATHADASGLQPPGTIVSKYGGGFVSNKVNLAGDPGTTTSDFTFTASQWNGDSYDTYTADVHITVNYNTGAVTATGNDPSGMFFGGSATLTADAGTSSGPASGSVSLSATGDVSDRAIRSCITFASGLQACADVFPLYVVCNPSAVPPVTTNCTTVPPPTDPAANDPAQNALADDNYGGAIQKMTDQLTNVMLYQLPIIGMMLDSKHQLETQRLYGETAARSHREYAPNEQICGFGTLAGSTVPSKYKVDDNASIIDTILQKRELLNITSPSAFGQQSDFISRLDKYRNIYCDKNDDNKEIANTLTFSSGSWVAFCQSPTSLRIGKDVDYQKTMYQTMTMDIDFTDTTSTPDEEDVLALAKNLYSNSVMSKIPEHVIAPFGTYTQLQDMRMLSAVRSVARSSFITAAAMRAKGSGVNAAQLQQVMQNLGISAADATALLGTNPSYFAQMEIITQKMYQDPVFYTNLYSNPANVARMKVVLQAVRLMADRDRFEQSLRREMLISMILEMRLRELQESYNDRTSKSGSPEKKR